MKKSASLALAALALLYTAGSGYPAPYFPYDSINEYYKVQPEPPAPLPSPSQQPSGVPVKTPPVPGQPVAITQAPEFLFPAQLGFGVAVGVPYDMMYIPEYYYFWQAGAWFRSSSYRGPWTTVGYSQLPAQLRKSSIAKIRELRNSEFSTFWQNKDRYQGKRFRPGREVKEGPAADQQTPEKH
jgi:hypothetical protein